MRTKQPTKDVDRTDTRIKMDSYSQNNEDQLILKYFGGIEKMKDISVLDLGANDGQTLSNSRLAIKNGAAAMLVEPSTICYSKLSKLYHENPRVQLLPVAVSDKSGIMEFYESGEHLGNGDHGLVSTLNASELNRWVDSGEKFVTTQAHVWNLDAVLEASELKKFDLISIDIEGEDLKVLNLMNLHALGCRMLIVEWNGNDREKFTEIAERNGLKIYHENAENLIFVK